MRKFSISTLQSFSQIKPERLKSLGEKLFKSIHNFQDLAIEEIKQKLSKKLEILLANVVSRSKQSKGKRRQSTSQGGVAKLARTSGSNLSGPSSSTTDECFGLEFPERCKTNKEKTAFLIQHVLDRLDQQLLEDTHDYYRKGAERSYKSSTPIKQYVAEQLSLKEFDISNFFSANLDQEYVAKNLRLLEAILKFNEEVSDSEQKLLNEIVGRIFLYD